jgi:hypothetical protein
MAMVMGRVESVFELAFSYSDARVSAHVNLPCGTGESEISI